MGLSENDYVRGKTELRDERNGVRLSQLRPPSQSTMDWVARTTDICISQFWGLGAPTSRCWQGRFHYEASSPGLWVATVSLCPHMVGVGRERAGSPASSYKDTNAIGSRPTFMISFNLDLPPYRPYLKIHWGLRFQHRDWGGGRSQTFSP